MRASEKRNKHGVAHRVPVKRTAASGPFFAPAGFQPGAPHCAMVMKRVTLAEPLRKRARDAVFQLAENPESKSFRGSSLIRVGHRICGVAGAGARSLRAGVGTGIRRRYDRRPGRSRPIPLETPVNTPRRFNATVPSVTPLPDPRFDPVSGCDPGETRCGADRGVAT